jgi:antitoxin ParD1/3/4
MPAKNGRNVSLTDEHEALVQRLIATGRYATASEVVRAALRGLERDEHQRLLEKWLAEGLTPAEEQQFPAGTLDKARSHLSAKIREGLDSMKGGQGIDGDEFFAKWRSRVEGERRRGKGRRSA